MSDSSKNLHRLRFTGDVDIPSPLEIVEDSGKELEDIAVYAAEDSDMYVFDYLGNRTGNYLTFFFDESKEVTKVDYRNLGDLERFAEALEQKGFDYSQSEVFWGESNGLSRLSKSVERSNEQSEVYLENIRELYSEVVQDLID